MEGVDYWPCGGRIRRPGLGSEGAGESPVRVEGRVGGQRVIAAAFRSRADENCCGLV